MPVSNRGHKYDQHKFIPSKASLSAWAAAESDAAITTKIIFPRSKGELFLPIPFSNSCGYIASFIGFTSRTYKWTQAELQGLICWLLLPFFPGRYGRAEEAWAGARQRCGSREAVLGSRSWSRNQVWAGRSTKHQADHQEAPGGMQHTARSDARQTINRPQKPVFSLLGN